jgi:predicted metal-dependent hydrolase
MVPATRHDGETPQRLPPSAVAVALMLEIEPLDAAISRLDLALLRAEGRRHDPVAVHEVAYCLKGLQALERRHDLDPELHHLIGQAIELATLCTPLSAESIELLRAKLLDIAAAIAVRSKP